MTTYSSSRMLDIALLLLRVGVGAFMFAHGAQKLFGWFGGRGLAGAEQMARTRGFRPARLWGPLAALSETAGGAGTALGLLMPLGPIGIVTSMLTVVTVDQGKGFFATKGGSELAWLYLVCGGALGLSGSGSYSLDALLGLALPPVVAGAAAALALAGLLALLATRRAPAPAPVP